MTKFKDPYIDPDTGTLINKLGLKKASELEQFEADIVPARILSLRRKGLKIESVYDIKKIHKYLFEPIFEWAGEFRTITMYKAEPILEGASVDYTPWTYIGQEMEELESKFKKIEWKKLSLEAKLKAVSSFIQELWQIHCFREGNTRSTALFLYFLLKTIGVRLNTNFLSKHAKYFRNALVLASCYSRSKPEYLLEIIKDCSSLKQVGSGKYKTIDGYEVDKYAYSYHTVEKMKTIKSLQDLETKEKVKI